MKKFLLMSLFSIFASNANANAGVIISPISGVVDVGGTSSPSNSLTTTYNQSGLSAGFTGGVTVSYTHLDVYKRQLGRFAC